MKHRYLSKKFAKVSTQMGEADRLSYKYNDLINLSLGDPDIITPEAISKTAFKDAIEGHTRYANSQGDIELRKAIKNDYLKNYNMEIGIDNLMVVVGATHGMFLALQAILDEGDEVVIHEPYFTPYELQIKMAGGKPVIVKTFEDDLFQINMDNLESVITDKTKAIIINTPNNPTGATFSREILEQIAELARIRDLLIISDDVYGAFSYKTPFVPIASLEGMKERTIVTGSFSKDFAMTGWRIGYVVAPSYIIDYMRDINEAVCYSAPTISQRAALQALKISKKVQPQIVKEYKKRVFYAYERLNKIPGLSLMEPQGSFYLFVNIKETGLTSSQVSKVLLKKAHVLVIPGTAFGESGEGYIRIACTVGIGKLKEAFDRIEKLNIFSTNGVKV